MRWAASILLLLSLAALSASGDTIVLKNGQRIHVSKVTEDAAHVSYDTPAGRLTLPRAIVARVEHDDFSPQSSSESLAPPVTPPQLNPTEGYNEAARGAVHDGGIDFGYIARLERGASSGSSTAIGEVVAGHHAAAQFLVARGDLDGAIDQYRQALTFAPDQAALLLNLSVLYLRESRFTAAMDPLEHARRLAPDSADVAKLMGWADYGADHLGAAGREWQRAFRLRHDSDVERALEKARRDLQAESDFREGDTAHFTLKYYGEANRDLARDILRTLEGDFRDLSSQLDYTPAEPIDVILYTNREFEDLTRAPSWAGALNDGRIRLPVQGLSSMTPDLARVLRHELTHSFVGQKTRGRCPAWLQEGIAQWMEGRRSSSAAAALVQSYDDQSYPSLGSLEGSWMGMSDDQAGLAYAWSLAAVESILHEGGMGDIERLLDAIGDGSLPEAALRATLHDSYSDLEQETIAYLRREYMQ